MKEMKNAFLSYYIYRQCCAIRFLEFGKDITINKAVFQSKKLLDKLITRRVLSDNNLYATFQNKKFKKEYLKTTHKWKHVLYIIYNVAMWLEELRDVYLSTCACL